MFRVTLTPLSLLLRHKLRYIGYIFILFAYPPLAYAEITAEQLVNDAYADGAMIATANACHIEKSQLNQLIFNQKKRVLDIAKQYQLPFLAKDYDEYVISGFESTMGVLANQSEDDEAFTAICSGVQEKIAKKIAP